MSTAEVKPVPALQPAPSAPPSPAPTARPLPQLARPEVYWGDWIAVRLWFLGMILLATLAVLDFVFGMFRK
jgi:hypothetical protein